MNQCISLSVPRSEGMTRLWRDPIVLWSRASSGVSERGLDRDRGRESNDSDRQPSGSNGRHSTLDSGFTAGGYRGQRIATWNRAPLSLQSEEEQQVLINHRCNGLIMTSSLNFSEVLGVDSQGQKELRTQKILDRV